MLSEVVTCNCVRNPGGHAESNPRPSEEGVSFYHVLRPLDHIVKVAGSITCLPGLQTRSYVADRASLSLALLLTCGF